MTTCWVAVASHDHVKAAVRGGFCQVDHGKEAPLWRFHEGDRLFYYSPREQMAAGNVLHAFTAVGEILAAGPYQAKTQASFRPFRRKVRYLHCEAASIRPLLPRLSFTRGSTSWGLVMRRGLFEIPSEDGRLIAVAMEAIDAKGSP